MRLKSKYTYLWVGWLAAFLAVEAFALVNREPGGDTLSEHVWHVLDKGDFWYYLLGAFLTWLVVHFLARK